jgi:hypothetical protein
MLDIIANNDWKRPIYFSSPSGSDVASALLHGYSGSFRDGSVKQNGMAFELTPLDGNSPGINRDRMYDNLMNVYHYGQMSNPDVLTDYYTRRHTVQYRSHFLRLAREYASDALRAEDMYARMEANPAMKVPGLPSKEDIKKGKERAIKLLKKSLKEMPVDVVIDHSEPTRSGDVYEIEGGQRRGYSDGVLHEYVQIFYLAGDKASARKLANQVADQLESIFNYFEKSDARISGYEHNVKDLYAAMEAYFAMYEAVADEELGDPESDLDRRMLNTINDLYNKIIPGMATQLKEAAENRNETVRRNSTEAGVYTEMMFGLLDMTDAMAIKRGFKGQPKQEVANPQLPAMQPQQNAPTGNALPTQP